MTLWHRISMAIVITLIIGLCPFYERNVFYIDQEGSVSSINIPASLDHGRRTMQQSFNFTIIYLHKYNYSCQGHLRRVIVLLLLVILAPQTVHRSDILLLITMSCGYFRTKPWVRTSITTPRTNTKTHLYKQCRLAPSYLHNKCTIYII